MLEILDARDEFRKLLILLSQNKWFNTVSSSHELSNKILPTIHKGMKTWEYSISKLVFKDISLERHVRPLKVSRLAKDKEGVSTLLLGIFCECNCISDEKVINDPILQLGTKLIIQFDYIDQTTEESKVLQSSWHLDKHDPTTKTSTSHPLYHYEFGGSEITKAEDFNFGDFILIDTPRLMHPPLDLVLSIDFIIKNFYHFDQHKNLTELPLYKRYINNAHHRLWRPYAISFASNFHDFSSSFEIDTAYAKNIIHCI